MKLQTQKLNECFPTVVGMLLDKPAAQVRRAMLGKTLAKESWSMLTCNSTTDKARRLAGNVERYLARRLPWLPLDSFSRDDAAPSMSQGAELDFTGRGAVTIRLPHGRHIVAFDAGMIYDSSPTTPAPIPAEKYLAYLINCNRVIERIYSEPKEG